jgi:hypothetical protein
MRVVRPIVNAVLMATLIKPMVKLTVSRWRRRAQESAATTVGIPVQELLEAALIEELAGPGVDAAEVVDEVIDEPAGRSLVRMVVITGALVVLSVGVSVTISRLIRRRREAQAAHERELVAIPVDASGEEATESVPQEALID